LRRPVNEKGVTLLSEVEKGSQLSAFVIASEHENCIWEAEFEAHD
jgi:hypothetical protein